MPRAADKSGSRQHGRAWALGARPERIAIDVGATLTAAHFDKEQAKGNFKGGYGHHPLLSYLDGSNEAPAGVLRAGNAGSNTASDHIEVHDERARSSCSLREA